MLGCMGSWAPHCAEPGERSRAARASPANAVTSQLSPRSPEIHHAQLAGATGLGAACAGGGYKPPGRMQTTPLLTGHRRHPRDPRSPGTHLARRRRQTRHRDPREEGDGSGLPAEGPGASPPGEAHPPPRSKLGADRGVRSPAGNHRAHPPRRFLRVGSSWETPSAKTGFHAKK